MLKDIDLKNSYTSGFDEPKFFFTEALIESVKFDLGLGFFSSSGIKSLAPGFAVFVANGGVMRVIINQYLSEDDKIAIELGQSKLIESIENKIITDISALQTALSGSSTVFFKCFSYLISINRIEFIATVSSKGGLAHDKYGIFTDSNNDKTAFIGSANWSKTAMDLNGETITVFSSWNDSKRVNEYQSLFDCSWISDTPHLIHIPMDKVKSYICDNFKVDSVLELIEEGVRLIENNNCKLDETSIPLPEYLSEKIAKKSQEPRFPFPTERDIQKNAYKSWEKNSYRGIFAMATGSGKTVTALNCLLKEYRKYGFYKAIIVVPTQALASQWEAEVCSFNFTDIVSTYTEKGWKDSINRYSTRTIFNPNKNIIIITTYATFNKPHFQTLINKIKGIEDFVYIADEVHNLGAASSLKCLPTKIKKRIGLSATPERIYDDIGSIEMYNFFNSYAPFYTYKYTMKQAIEEGILCSYEYHPIFVELTEIEMEEYKKITKELCKFIDSKTGKYTDKATSLLLKRKRIVHKAENKKIAVVQLIDQLRQNKKLDYTFVFVPEGYEPDYSSLDSYDIKSEDAHIIDEYADIFKASGYTYHKYLGGINDSKAILSSFAKGDIKILLSMKCLDEGVDIPRAENAIFCSSTGNPRQFIQRRGRVLRKHKDKKKAFIWDLIVLPPIPDDSNYNTERNLFISEVKRVVNFAVLAEESNKINILYGKLKEICYHFNIDLFDMVEREESNYN
jgi:superfamily II DNA or RNA helicase